MLSNKGQKTIKNVAERIKPFRDILKKVDFLVKKCTYQNR